MMLPLPLAAPLLLPDAADVLADMLLPTLLPPIASAADADVCCLSRRHFSSVAGLSPPLFDFAADFHYDAADA